MSDDANPKDRPVETIRDNAVSATIWRNTSEKGKFYSTQFSRSYKDKEGKFQETNTFSGSQLLQLSQVATKAYEQEQKLRKQDRAENKAKEQEPAKETDRER